MQVHRPLASSVERDRLEAPSGEQWRCWPGMLTDELHVTPATHATRSTHCEAACLRHGRAGGGVSGHLGQGRRSDANVVLEGGGLLYVVKKTQDGFIYFLFTFSYCKNTTFKDKLL